MTQSLPALGSKEALESQEAFRTWSMAAAARMEVPFILNYTCTVDFAIDEPGEEFSLDAEVLAKGKAVHRSLREMQHQVNFKVKEEQEGEGEFNIDFLLDGEWISIFMQSDKVEELMDGLQFRVEQPFAEQAYLDYMKLYPIMMASFEAEEGIDADMFEAMLEPLLEITPKDLISNMHPAGYWNAGTQILTCRKLSMTEKTVDAYLTFDFQKKSILHDTCAALFHLIGEESYTEDDFFETMKQVEGIAEKVIIHLQFDKDTGAPLLMMVDASFNAEELMLDEDFSFRFRLNYKGTLSRPTDMTKMVFIAQNASPEKSMDVTGILELGMAEMQKMQDELESEEDMDF